MKIKELLDHLKDFDPEKEVFLFELSSIYDTVLLGVHEEKDKVVFSIKNTQKGQKETIH